MQFRKKALTERASTNRLSPFRPVEQHPHEGLPYHMKGLDLPTQYHGGPVQVRNVDASKLDPQHRGSKFGRGFYTTSSPEIAKRREAVTAAYHKRTTRGSLTVKKDNPEANILHAHADEARAHPALVKAIREFSPKYAKTGDVGMGDMTWRTQVDKFGTHHGYDAIRYDLEAPEGNVEHNQHTTVWKHHGGDKLVHVNSRLAVKKGFKQFGEGVLRLFAIVEAGQPAQHAFRFVPSHSEENEQHSRFRDRRAKYANGVRDAVRTNTAIAGTHKMVVFRSTHPDPTHWTHEMFHVIHPSAKRAGIWQMSQFDTKTNAPIGDIESESRESAIRTLSGEQTKEHGTPYGSQHYRAEPFGRKKTNESLDESYDYSCAMVDIPEDIATKVRKFSSDIPDTDLPTDEESISSDGARAGKGREQEIHVTALFGIHTEAVSNIKRVLKGFKPLQLRLGKTGVFPASEKRDSDVLWVSVDSPDLHRLNALLCKELEYTNNYPEYKPHCTVAYLKAGCGKKYAGKTIANDTFVVDTIMFASKSGETTAIKLEGDGKPSLGESISSWRPPERRGDLFKRIRAAASNR